MATATTTGALPAEKGPGSARMRRAFPWLATLAFAAVLLVTFLVLNGLTYVPVTGIETSDDLATFDFTSGIGKISRGRFDFWSNALYAPEDFSAGTVGEPDLPALDDGTSNEAARQECRYGTYCLVLSLPAGHTYAFTTTGDTTEIVIQRANFAHAKGSIFELYLGPQEQVFHLAEANMLRAELPLGILLAAGLLFLGVGLFSPGRRQFLRFVLACPSLMVRDAFVNPKPVMVLLPELDWYLARRLRGGVRPHARRRP